MARFGVCLALLLLTAGPARPDPPASPQQQAHVLEAPVSCAVQSLDPEVPVSRIATMEQNIAADFAPQRLVLALGASRANVLRLVLGQSARLVGVGLTLGLAAALGAGKLLARVVYGASAADVGVLGLVALGLGAVGMLASYLPARRATRIDPLAALREE